jgi:hypothetical protein
VSSALCYVLTTRFVFGLKITNLMHSDILVQLASPSPFDSPYESSSGTSKLEVVPDDDDDDDT